MERRVGEPNTGRSSHQNNSERMFAVYVAGIPSSTTAFQLKDFFSQYGRIDEVETFPLAASQHSKKKVARAGPDRRSHIRGYCFLKTKSQAAFNRIINKKVHFFVDRYLSCREILSGPDLAKQNQDMNQRRVIVKQAPIGLDEFVLEKVIEQLAGQLEMFYVYRSNRRSYRARKYYTCSALFVKPQSVSVMLKLGSIPGPRGHPIYFKKFYHLSKNEDINPSLGSQSSSEPEENKEEKSICASEHENDQKKNKFQLEPTKPPADRLRKEKKTILVPSCVSNSRQPILLSKQYEGSSYFHSARPTSSKYHSCRRLAEEVPSYLKQVSPSSSPLLPQWCLKYRFKVIGQEPGEISGPNEAEAGVYSRPAPRNNLTRVAGTRAPEISSIDIDLVE